MKKLINILIISLMPLTLYAQSFSSLWKKVGEAAHSDLPRTQTDVLRQIVSKAEKEKAYGHLLKAQFALASVNTQLSPDSLDTEKARLTQKAEQVKDPVLKAVYASALGRMYDMDDEDAALAAQWYKRSMENYELLASYKDEDYAPAVEIGVDSKTFYNDLLHVIGFEAGQYATLAKYYKTHGNRPAAAICEYYDLEKNRGYDSKVAKKSKYLQRVDSLLKEYGDLKEGGLFAVEHYDFISRCEDVTTDDRINYINYALARWGAWPGCNRLRNAQADLQQPTFNISLGDYMMLPDAIRQIRINSIRNIQTLNINIYRLNVDGNTELDPMQKGDYQKLQKLMVATPVQSVQRRYVGLAPWQETSDSLSLEGMPVGVYLLEATTDNNNVEPQRTLLHVSNLYVMHEDRPDNTMRFVVVNATTGAPVHGAQLMVTMSERWQNHEAETTTLKTDKNGIADCKYDKQRPTEVYVFTDQDKACDNFRISSRFSYYSNDKVANMLSLHTDRSIYRPGQQVNVAAIAYTKDNDALTADALAGENLTFTLRDANYKEVAKQEVTTDEYGTASAVFTLPQTGLTGQFSIQARTNKTSAGTSFAVEQYKRPTFEVEFDAYKEAYSVGDTVLLKGRARSYSGMPVQGAKVAYKVSRQESMWWYRWSGGDSEELLTDTIQTADDGSFTVKMPMELPDNERSHRPGLYNIKVVASVTDVAGETHSAESRLPLSLKSTFLTVQLPSKAQRDSLRTFSFSRTNVAGEAISGEVRYRVDGGEWRTAQANKPITIEKKLPSGVHTMEAICESDTVEKRFVLFSLSDKKPAEQTHDWFYLSSDQFPANGKPVYLQVGSSDEALYGYYSVYSDGKLIDEGRKTLHGEVHTEKLTYKESMGKGIVINMAWVHRGHLYTHSVKIARPMPDKWLKLAWKTFRDKLVPGQKEEWTLEVLSPEGKATQAQLMATLYDKSLDAIQPHRWNFSAGFYNPLPYVNWVGGSNMAVGLYGYEPLKSLPYSALAFSTFDDEMFEFASPYLRYYMARPVMARTMALGAAPDGVRLRENDVVEKAVVAEDEIKLRASAIQKTIISKKEAANDATETQGESTQIRENLQETAFFFPALTTDEKGVVSIKFTLPESVTTWRFMGLAHNKAIDYGLLESEAVAQKTVMVQPNLPRFLRAGDKATISARISNTSEKTVSGTARLQLVDPETDKVVREWSKPFSADAQQTTAVSYDVDVAQLERNAKGQTLLVARVIAEGRGFSDGEQHYLPLLPAKEYVTTTVPFSQEGAGVKTIDLTKLFPTQDAQNKLTVEYTNHPAWLMVQALPTLANPNEKNAISLSSAIFANTIGQQLLNSDPAIGRTIKLWQQEQGSETSLTSQLEKNEELKTLVLSETPWVAQAARETEQKHLLAGFLDANLIDYRLNDFSKKLSALQRQDGSFSWWPGMDGSAWMTVSVVETLTRLGVMTGQQRYDDMLEKAFRCLDKRIAEEVAELKRQEKKGLRQLSPSEMACHYLYASALYGRKQTSDMHYLVDMLEKMPTALTIYGKAGAAVILAQYGRQARAKQYLQSLTEYTVYNEELGRYYDTPRAYYSWSSYKIPTQVMAIEALKALSPDDSKTISDMQRWLLHEKRTTSWDTPINSTNAVYAFLADAKGHADMSKLVSGEHSALKLDGQTIEMPTATAGLGYVKTAVQPGSAKTFTAEKTSEGTSWGALYAQYWQASTDVEAASAGLSVQREIRSADGKPLSGTLHVGDKVLVRITITADRDYDFVQVEDKRAACLEPAQQLSGYNWGYYCAPQDNATRYYFNMMAKGKHVVETTYYVDREGEYQQGICTVQCAYSPEYSGRAAGKTLRVEK